MSRRVTRSSARQSADLSASITNPPPPESPQPPASDLRPSSSRKRKASTSGLLQDDVAASAAEPPQSRKKRQKIAEAGPETNRQSSSRKRKRTSQNVTMSSPGEQLPEDPEPTSPTGPSTSSTKKSKSKESASQAKRRSSGGKKSKKAKEPVTPGTTQPPPPPPPPPADTQPPGSPSDDGEEEEAERQRRMEEDAMLEEAMESRILSRHGGGGYRSAFAGLMSGTSSNLRNILENLRKNDSPDEQYMALTSLSEFLLISTEDNLAGTFSPDSFLKELIRLMQPGDFGENQEIMLLACRCIANMMEALPTSTAAVVYGGAVPVLVSKLLEIHFMDLAEQALITLEKISSEFPASIVREGGLTACLTYLDFFATGVQRTAVTTAANCCRNIPEDSFSTVKEVMPILQNTLNSNDQRVVEQGCVCVSGIVESFKYLYDKTEELMSIELLKAILRLLLPTSTNMISSNIHTQLLRVLSSTARASPKLTADLFRLNVVETLYQILTGVSPPSGTEDVAQKIDSVVIMQALIHRPREQIAETLTVICELLPALEPGKATLVSEMALITGHDLGTRGSPEKREHRMQSLSECREELRRFAVVLLPTLTDAYSSTVNLSVRERVLTAQLRMLSCLDTKILEDALRPVPYSSYLASMLSQQDHPTLVSMALEAARLLIDRLDHIYRYQFHREGVVSEVRNLAERPLKNAQPDTTCQTPAASDPFIHTAGVVDRQIERAAEADSDDEGEDVGEGHDDESDSDSEASPVRPYSVGTMPDVQDAITGHAERFIQEYDASEGGRQARSRAEAILENLRHLVIDIAKAYDADNLTEGKALFTKLVKYFEGNALESVTSYELLDSKVVSTLLDIFQEPDGSPNEAARAAFTEVFMGSPRQHTIKTATSGSPNTPFSVLIQKLQDLLSRSEHFEVLTVHSNSFDSNRCSAASMLAKQIRVRLAADDESGIPASFRHITVSIHAIATLKALDEYLRPRIAISERVPRRSGAGSMANLSIGGIDPALRSASGAVASQSAEHSGLPSSAGNQETSNSQSSARRSKSKGKLDVSTADSSGPAPGTDKPSSSRQSSRKSKGRATGAETPPPPPPPPANDELSDALEVADEAHMSDEDDMDHEAAFDEVIEEFEETDEDAPDPAAVSMEVADTGRVTATQDDGTRIDTPSSTQASSSRPPMPAAFPESSVRPSAYANAQALLNSLSSRSMSYASALSRTPQNWHLEFTVNGQPISSETTMYRAVHLNQGANEDLSGRNIWSQTHTIGFKRVDGPAPAESSTLNTSTTPEPPATQSGSSLPQSLEKNPISAEILRLLRILHEINSNLDDLLASHRAAVKVNAEPVAQFVNTKLTAKLNRQLEEPLIVASNCLPTWSEDLARLYPFLFPFETRHLFLQSTSYGYSRSMSRWQNSQSGNDTSRHRHRDERPFLGRLQRQKVRISRDKIMESAFKVLELYGASPSILEVEYFDEVGTGLGPTLEFYSTVSKEFSKKKLKMWRENESTKGEEFAFGKQGLFPAPMSEAQLQKDYGRKVLNFFRLLGKFVARSMLDSRIVDVSFNPVFFRIASEFGPQPSTLNAIKAVDEDLARSLELIKKFIGAKKKIQDEPRVAPALKAQKLSRVRVSDVSIDDLALDFTLPGYPHIELIQHGSRTSVNMDNVNVYLDKVIEYTVGKGIKKQIEAFKIGFSQVFPYNAMKAFTPEELVMLFGRNEEDWSVEALLDSTKADHGYNLDSKSVRNLMQAMSELTPEQRRDFLQFITGSPKLPIGGFRNLTPMFTVVCKPSEAPYAPDDYLPSVMTCVNYLKLPDYSSLDVMRERLSVAIREGQGSFHLS